MAKNRISRCFSGKDIKTMIKDFKFSNRYIICQTNNIGV